MTPAAREDAARAAAAAATGVLAVTRGEAETAVPKASVAAPAAAVQEPAVQEPAAEDAGDASAGAPYVEEFGILYSTYRDGGKANHDRPRPVADRREGGRLLRRAPGRGTHDYAISNENRRMRTYTLDPEVVIYGNQLVGRHDGTMSVRITAEKLLELAPRGPGSMWLEHAKTDEGPVTMIREQYVPDLLERSKCDAWPLRLEDDILVNR